MCGKRIERLEQGFRASSRASYRAGPTAKRDRARVLLDASSVKKSRVSAHTGDGRQAEDNFGHV